MEGFLLVFTKERSAQVRYCVLDCGIIRCYERFGSGAAAAGSVDCIELTRHRVRVKPLVGGNVSPNRFVVHASEVKRKDEAGRLAAVALREASHVFAAATPEVMCRWVNAIHNWRRHTFDDPLADLAPDEQRVRRAVLETDRLGVVELAARFDIRLVSCRPIAGAAAADPADPTAAAGRAAAAARTAGSKTKKKTTFPKIRPISAISEAAARKVLHMRPSRGLLASMMPSFPASTAKREAS